MKNRTIITVGSYFLLTMGTILLILPILTLVVGK